MPKKSNTSTTQEMAKLRKPMEMAATKIKTLLEDAKAITVKLDARQTSYELIQDEYDELIDVGSRMLFSLFTTDKESQLFRSTRTLDLRLDFTAQNFSTDYRSPVRKNDRYDHLQHNLRSTIKYLSGLLKSLDSFEEEVKNGCNDAENSNLDPPLKTSTIAISIHNSPQMNNRSSNINNNQMSQTIPPVIKCDFSSLAAALKQHGINDHDLSELENAIKSDPSQPSTIENLGPKVKEWIGSMIFKFSDKISDLSIEKMITLLTTALKSYYFS